VLVGVFDKEPSDSEDVSASADKKLTGESNKKPQVPDTEDKKTAPATEADEDNETREKPNTKVPSRTVMLYVVGSDLESRYGAATMDLMEIEASGVNEKKTNVLVYTGGAKEWQNTLVDEDENYILLLEDEELTVVESHKAKNMGKAATLTEFLEYCEENYPADEYELIFWNHGAGPLYGYGLDEKNGDLLSLQELSDALEDSPFGKSKKLELLGFDACLMGSIETAWVFRDYAEYFVASQEIEPGQGWDYAFLSELDGCKNGDEVGKVIVEYYFDFYEDLFKKSPRAETEITLSCVDLYALGDVEKALEELFENIDDDLGDGTIKEISRCRYKSKAFGKFASSTSYDLVDLKHLATLLEDEYPDEAEALLDALEEYVVYEDSNVKNAGGVSIYHPYDTPTLAKDASKLLNALSFAPKYVTYINNFSKELRKSGSGSNYRSFSKNTGEVSVSGDKSDLSMQLTKEQLETFSSAKYYIFKELPAEETFSKQKEYLNIFSGQDVTLSASGELSATYQGKAVFAKKTSDGEYSEFPLSMYQIYDGTLEEKYYFPCMFYDLDNGDFPDLLPANWLMRIRDGKPQLLNAYDMASDENKEFPNKYLVNAEDYELYFFGNNSYTVGTDDNGNTQLTFTGSSYGFEYERDDFSLELRPIDYDDGYYAVFVIEDVYGNTHFSSFFRLGE